MTHLQTHPPHLSKASSRWLLLVAVLALFTSLCLALIPNWGRSTYYDYGWLVPPIVAYFLYRRWSDSPSSTSGSFKSTGAPLICAILFIFPLRYIEQFDPLWRFPLWLHAFCFLVALHCLLASVKGWKPSIHCLPASALILTAVPLPSFIETPLIYNLTQAVVNLGHTSLLLTGHAAERMANLFIVNHCLLDVAEGCSGVRSFQSSLMASLCLGELTQLNLFRRLTLVILSLIIAILANASRIFALGYSAYHGGQTQVDKLHDPLGAAVLTLVFASLSLSAFLLMPKSGSNHSPTQTA